MENQIKLVQAPIIAHEKLQQIGLEVSTRISNLNLENQVATIDTIKVLKEMRADLNKELAEFESQRKIIKEGVNNPYLEFEAIYKSEISEKYKSGIDILKDKIAAFEDSVKDEKRKAVEAYFNEICQVEKIDFISFDRLDLDINLSVSEKKYKEQVSEFVSKVLDDLELIKKSSFKAETLAEYKKTLNASKAIVSVQERKEAEEIELARLKANMIASRENNCKKIGLQWNEIVSCWEFNPEIYISKDDLENLSDKDYFAKFASIEAKIAEIKSQEITNEKKNPEPIQAPIISAPKISEPASSVNEDPIKMAKFQVKATMSKLRALGAYMKENGIEYTNI